MSRSKGHWAGIRWQIKCASWGLCTSIPSIHRLMGLSKSNRFFGWGGWVGVEDGCFGSIQNHFVKIGFFVVKSDTLINRSCASNKPTKLLVIQLQLLWHLYRMNVRKGLVKFQREFCTFCKLLQEQKLVASRCLGSVGDPPDIKKTGFYRLL